jgi:putative transposase
LPLNKESPLRRVLERRVPRGYNIDMPAKNALKKYVENGHYHIFNRGVEKRQIFQEQQDYDVFLTYLGEYLKPKDTNFILKALSSSDLSVQEKEHIMKLARLNNFNEEITLLAYSLMPNHFHLFVKQKSAASIDKFMRSLCTRYVMYFNRKYQRIGALFQGVYKAVLIEDESYYTHISRYIHAQAIGSTDSGNNILPSSYPEYLKLRRTSWVHPEEILSLFSSSNPDLSYAKFVSEYNPSEKGESFKDSP